MKSPIILLLASFFFLPAQASSPTDSLQISLLTIEPRADQVYTIYGHTALRVCDPTQDMDLVFNWGTFDFGAPHFLYRFIRGETDYYLSVTTYAQFLFAYQWGQARAIEQRLDLSPEGKERLMERLTANMAPEQRIYRYNFLFDNCTTRVRDLIESAGWTLADLPQETTVRQLIHSCTKPYPWMTFGIDLLIGSGADGPITTRQTLFLPMHLQEALDRSPIVAESQQVLAGTPAMSGSGAVGLSPFVIACFLLVVSVVLTTVRGLRRLPLGRALFGVLFFATGMAGCLVAFMAAFSEHPCVWPNFNLLWLQPLHLIAAAGYVFERRAGFPAKVWRGYHIGNVLLLSGFLLGVYAMPQAIPPAAILLSLCLLWASGYWLFAHRARR
jgi:hypothetical protein